MTVADPDADRSETRSLLPLGRERAVVVEIGASRPLIRAEIHRDHALEGVPQARNRLGVEEKSNEDRRRQADSTDGELGHREAAHVAASLWRASRKPHPRSWWCRS